MNKGEALLSFAKKHVELEHLRKVRNGWALSGIGGAAVLGLCAFETEGNLRGLCIAAIAGVALGTVSQVLDAEMAIDSTRSSLDGQAKGIIKADENQSALKTNESKLV